MKMDNLSMKSNAKFVMNKKDSTKPVANENN